MQLKQYHYNILLFLVVSLWGSLYIGNRILLQHMPVLVLLFFRCLVTALVLIPATRVMGLKQIERQDWGKMLVVGFVGYFASNAMLTVCTLLTNASLASLLNSLNPIFMIFFAHFMVGESITPKKLFVVLLAVVGAVIIIGAPGGNVNMLGVASAVASVVLWSFSVVYMKKLTRKYHALTVTGYGMAVSAVFCLPTGIFSAVTSATPITFNGEVVVWLLYVCLCCTAFAHMMWNYCVSHQEAGHCAAFYPVQPMVSMLLGWAILGERMTRSFLAGSALIIVSVALNSLPERKKKETVPGGKQ